MNYKLYFNYFLAKVDLQNPIFFDISLDFGRNLIKFNNITMRGPNKLNHIEEMLAPSFGPRPVAYVPDFTPSTWAGPIPAGPGPHHPGPTHPAFNPSHTGQMPLHHQMPHMTQHN